jgi:hypothetical protein
MFDSNHNLMNEHAATHIVEVLGDLTLVPESEIVLAETIAVHERSNLNFKMMLEWFIRNPEDYVSQIDAQWNPVSGELEFSPYEFIDYFISGTAIVVMLRETE